MKSPSVDRNPTPIPPVMKKYFKAKENVLRCAKKWYDESLLPCEYGKRCKKHQGVCQLLYAVKEFNAIEKEVDL